MQFFGPHVIIMYLHDIVYTCKGKHSRQSANFKEKELEQDSNPRSPAYQAGALSTEATYMHTPSNESAHIYTV